MHVRVCVCLIIIYKLFSQNGSKNATSTWYGNICFPDINITSQHVSLAIFSKLAATGKCHPDLLPCFTNVPFGQTSSFPRLIPSVFHQLARALLQSFSLCFHFPFGVCRVRECKVVRNHVKVWQREKWWRQNSPSWQTKVPKRVDGKRQDWLHTPLSYTIFTNETWPGTHTQTHTHTTPSIKQHRLELRRVKCETQQENEPTRFR